jgi:hypothetical protein
MLRVPSTRRHAASRRTSLGKSCRSEACRLLSASEPPLYCCVYVGAWLMMTANELGALTLDTSSNQSHHQRTSHNTHHTKVKQTALCFMLKDTRHIISNPTQNPIHFVTPHSARTRACFWRVAPPPFPRSHSHREIISSSSSSTPPKWT